LASFFDFSMSWTPGANVYVAIAEQDELAAGKVLHENKSGTVRVILNDGSKVTVGPEEVFENPNKTPKSRQRSRSPARKSTGGRGRSPGRPKSPARTASAGRKRSTSKGRKAATTPKTKEEKPEKGTFIIFYKNSIYCTSCNLLSLTYIFLLWGFSFNCQKNCRKEERRTGEQSFYDPSCSPLEQG